VSNDKVISLRLIFLQHLGMLGVLRIKVGKSADGVDGIIRHRESFRLHADVEVTVSERSLPVLFEQVGE